MAARRKYFGWGSEGEGLSEDEKAFALATNRARFGRADFDTVAVAKEADIRLAAPRIAPPASLAAICSSDHHDRLTHTYAQSFPDYVRAMAGDFAPAPDVVATPRSEDDVAAVLDWAGGAQASVTIYGGGSSVCGGTEPRIARGQKAAISLDMRGMGQVVEVDKTSRAALIDGGTYGPALEAQLKPHGVTLRHFPQSFEYSTLGGWIATRSGGHFATLYTHIDDLVESLRIVTPKGLIETRRLPGSGAGPSPDRMFIGSEGILGVITRAWVRLQDRPKFRAGGAVRFKDFFTAARALRAVSQSGLYPANCRILDPQEAKNTGAGDGSFALMVLAFESGDHDVGAWMTRALECCRDHGGDTGEIGGADAHRAGAADRWRTAFIRMPYIREMTLPMGIIDDTFETSITWDRFEAFHDAVKSATAQAVKDVSGQTGNVTCRVTHVYPDGPAPYFSFHALGRHGQLAEQWLAIKSRALDAVIDNGGTVTHHHAVGRDHRPWYDRQRPPLFAEALRAAKKTLDPQGLLNAGVLIDV
ncbi:MAG: FAD-binding oxidoreductase [Variibacter sp.]